MECVDENTLVAYSGHTLEGAPRERVEEHLAACSACRDLLFALATDSGDPARASGAPASKLGRYVVGESIGSGAMGTVFSGFDPDLRRRVALKVLNSDPTPAAQARLVREAQALAQLSHPNVVAVYDVGRSDREVFLAMELLVGRDLARWLTEAPRSWKQIVDVFIDVAKGLAAAHAAGIVHRDLKPRNVVVEETGRVCVTDFGLARVLEDAPRGAVDDENRPAEVRSIGTASAGTPAYMAPEQIDGQPADERSDQFSFCVALYEALTGGRPFAGGTLAELREAMRTGVTMRGSNSAPSWLCRVLERGLAEDPQHRFASVDDLVLVLQRGRARGRRRVAIAAAVVVAGAFAVTGGLAAQRMADAEPAVAACTGADRHVAAVWTAERGARLREAFVATGVPYAADAWRATDRAITVYRDRWIAGWRDACEATAVRKEQSAELLDRRMVCLERRRAELSALVDVIGEAERSVIAEAPAAIARLPAPEACADRAAMLDGPAPPTTATRRVAVAVVAQGIAESRALWAAGRYARGLERVRAFEAQAEALDHRPTLASYLAMRGLLEDETSAFDPAEATWRRTIQVAAEAGDARLVARTWLDLIRLIGVRKGDSTKALALIPAAQAAVALARDEDLENRMHSYLGSVHRMADALPEAERELRQALAGYQRRARTSRDLDVGTASTNLGLVVHGLGKLEEALQLHRAALAIFDEVYGANHPRTGAVHNNLGMVLMGLDRFDEARAEFRIATKVLEATLGPDHSSLAGLLSNLALAEGGLGHRQDAVATHRRAIAILERKLPPGDPKLVTARGNLALELVSMGGSSELAEARRLIESVVADAEVTFGPNDRRTALHVAELAEVLVKQDECAKARPLFRRAIRIQESVKPVDDHALGLAIEGSAACAASNAERIALLERALALRLPLEGQGHSLATTQLALARALRATDPARARKLAADARVLFLAAGERGKSDVAAIDAERW